MKKFIKEQLFLRKTRSFAPLLVLLILQFASSARAAPDVQAELPDFQIAILDLGQTPDPARESAIKRILWEVRKRTSIASAIEVPRIAPEAGPLHDHPILFLFGESTFPPLSDAQTQSLGLYLQRGGTLLVDFSDGRDDGPFAQSVKKLLKKALPASPMAKISKSHVLYKSFFLVDRHGGRQLTWAHLLGMEVEDRMAVVISANDLLGALARDDFGSWLYDVGPGGNATRETSLRLSINLIMYALCLDYKEDQVHIPFILQRRR
ncbi:DUF4159 domain-containing protein [Myxococcota bacterium]|nr:DUF4159 domain-containing protein [Myxococcota bacterium]